MVSTPANDRWLAKNVEAEEMSDKQSSSSEFRPESPKHPEWSRKDEKEIDEMLGMGDHAPPVHQMSNDNIMTLVGSAPPGDYFDDEEEVSTLANDTIANETFFKNNRLSPPRQAREPFKIPDFTSPDANKHNSGVVRDSPTKTVPETPPKGVEKHDFEAWEGRRGMSKRFWRIFYISACFGAFLIAAITVLGMNYHNIREERLTKADFASSESGSSLRGPTLKAEDADFDFSVRTSTPTMATPVPSSSPGLVAPTTSAPPTIASSAVPSDHLSFMPSIATLTPTTPEPTSFPTIPLSMGPTVTAEPTEIFSFSPSGPTTEPSAMPTGQPTTAAPTTVAPTMFPTTPIQTGNPTTPAPTNFPTTSEPTESPPTPAPTKDVSKDVSIALIETLTNARHFPRDTMAAIQARDESSMGYKIVKWLSRDPNLDSYSDDIIVQRFALSALYMGLTKDVNSNPMASTWMTYTDFCEWTVSSETLCNSNGFATSIHLETFGLEGEFVPEIGLLGKTLTRLVVSDNNIYGSIPSEFGLLTELQRLQTHGNDMVGRLPTQLGNMRNLVSIRLGRNKYSSTIPTQLANLYRLETLHMPFNRLTGPLPYQLVYLDSLSMINLKENNLTGEIPKNFAKMAKLTDLELHHNDFTGEIKEKKFCKNLDIFIVDCTELYCKCCEDQNCSA